MPELAHPLFIVLHMEIDAPDGDVYLKTGVYDGSAGKAGTLEIPLNVVRAKRQ